MGGQDDLLVQGAGTGGMCSGIPCFATKGHVRNTVFAAMVPGVPAMRFSLRSGPALRTGWQANAT